MIHIKVRSVEIRDVLRELADASIVGLETDICEDEGPRDQVRNMSGDHSVPSTCL